MALDPVYETLFRYFHVLAGITWIGLLYFFNLVNLPLLKFDMKKPFDVDAAEKATANITLKTLFWFRWGAAFTVLFGLLLLDAKMRQITDVGGGAMDYFLDSGPGGYLILLGVVLGLIMAINVWFIIWPNQQVILSNNKKIAAGEGDAEAMKKDNGERVPKAVLASRFNTWASIPMLFGMVFGAHNTASDWDGLTGPLAILAVVVLLMVYFSNKK